MQELHSTPLHPVHPWLIMQSRKFLPLKWKWDPVLLEINLIFIVKNIIKTWSCDRPHYTITPGTLIAFSSTICGFSLAQYTLLCWLFCTIKFEYGFTWSNNWVLDIFPFITLVLGLLTKLQSSYLGHSHLVHGQVSECKASIFDLTKFIFSLVFVIPISQEHCVTDFSRNHAKPTWLYQHLSVEILSFCTNLSNILNCSFSFKLTLDSFYYYPWWWSYIKINPPTLLNVNDILHFPVTPL